MNLILDKLKQFPLVVFSVLALFICGIAIFLRAPLVDELSLQETELYSKIQTMRENLKHSKDLDQQVGLLDDYVADAKGRLFNLEERSKNAAFLYALDDGSEVVIANVSPVGTGAPGLMAGGPNALKLHGVQVYRIAITGSFDAILRFIHEIQRAKPFIHVTSFTINSSGPGGSGAERSVASLSVAVLAEKE